MMSGALIRLLLGIMIGGPEAQQQPIGKTLRVTRCTLNGMPRMAVVVLSPDITVAYDARECRLALAWKGEFDQRTWASSGERSAMSTLRADRWYYQASDTSIWQVEQNGQPVFPAVRFRGYTFGENNVKFHFLLTLPGGEEVKGTEVLQTHFGQNDQLILQRRIEFDDMPPKTRISLPLRGEVPWDRFETLGTAGVGVDQETYVLTFKKDGYSICGFAFN
ncbi:MAG: hypothetical protein FLDDKLPJ_00259 [Phycisphaerae bacterium]|nr:hypothetical protein [Phycisphaerae bacterium]